MSLKHLVLIIVLVLCASFGLAATYYVNYTGGDDTKTGASEANAIKTNTQVNNLNLSDGDKVLFARNEIWRMPNRDGWLKFKSGTSNFITYGAYGSGTKPTFLCSINLSFEGNWSNTTNPSIWRTNNTYASTIGALIFNAATSVGVNNASGGLDSYANIDSQGEWFYNTTEDHVYLNSSTNPGLYYTSIEGGTRTTNESCFDLTGRTYVEVSNLSLKWGATMGIEAGGDSNHLNILDNEFDLIGGTFHSGSTTTRYGNCIQFWGNHSNILVSRNNMSNCYDAGITSQYSKPATFENVTYSYNMVWNTRDPFEYFNSNQSSNTTNFLIDHNTFVSEQGTWWVRANTYSRLATNGATISGYFNVTNNVLLGESGPAILFFNTTRDGQFYEWNSSVPVINYNFYNRSNTLMNISFMSNRYFNTLAQMQANTTFEVNGYEGNPQMIPGSNYVPMSGFSPLCSMSNTGSYVGAQPCGCVTPFEDYTVNVSTTFCPGTYNLNDTNGNGAIIINANNIIVDGDGCSIFGNNSNNAYGFWDNGKHNVTFKNFNISRMNRGIFTNTANNITIINNNFKDLTNAALVSTSAKCYGYLIYNNSARNISQYFASLDGHTDIKLDSNYIYNTNKSTTSSLVDSSGGDPLENITLSNNHLENMNLFNCGKSTNKAYFFNNEVFSNVTYYGILCSSTRNNFTNSYIYNNTFKGKLSTIYIKNGILFQNITFSGNYINALNGSTTIYMYNYSEPKNITVRDSSFYNSNWNGIDLNLNDTYILNNYISGHLHGGIDLFTPASGGYYLFNNTIVNKGGLYLDDVYNVLAENNSFINISDSYLIGIDEACGNCTFRNNYGYLSEDNFLWYCYSIGGINTLGFSQMFVNNNFTRCNNKTIKDSGKYSEYFNNYYPTNEDIYLNISSGSWTNITSYQATSLRNTYIEISQPAYANYLSFVGTNLVNFTSDFRTWMFNSLTAPSNDIYNVSNYKKIADNVASYTGTLGAGEQWIVGDYGEGVNCTIPFEDYTVNISTTFCPGTYNLNDTNGNGAIRVNANNIIIDCNSALFLGNDSGSSRAFDFNSKSNVTLQNCYARAYHSIAYVTGNNNVLLNNNVNNSFWGIYVVSGSGTLLINNTLGGNYTGNQEVYIASIAQNGTIRNNMFFNKMVYSRVGVSCDGSNWNIGNNTFIQGDGILVKGANNLIDSNNFSISNHSMKGYITSSATSNNNTISNNIFSNSGLFAFFISNSSYLTISGNQIINISNARSTGGFYIEGDFLNSNIKNNRIESTSYPIKLTNIRTFSSNISGNNISNFDVGITIYNSSNVVISDNYLMNGTRGDDGYNMGFWSWGNSTNVTIRNNTIQYGSVGMWIQSTRNISIVNNTCLQFSDSEILSGALRNKGDGWIHEWEPTSCILIGPQYKGYLGDSLEQQNDTLVNKFRGYNVTDAYLADNIFTSNVQTFLHINGLFGNKDISLPTSWYVKFWGPTNLTDADEFYNNPSFDRLTVVPSVTSGISTILKKCRYGMANTILGDEINFTVSKTMLTFQNDRPMTNNLSVFNLTVPNNDIYNVSNGQLLANNQTSYSVTLGAGHQINVGAYGTDFMPEQVVSTSGGAYISSGTYGANISKTIAAVDNGVCTQYSNKTDGYYYNVTYSCTGDPGKTVQWTISFNTTDGIYAIYNSSAVYGSLGPSSGGGGGGGGAPPEQNVTQNATESATMSALEPTKEKDETQKIMLAIGAGAAAYVGLWYFTRKKWR